MIRAILLFLAFFAIFFVGIGTFRKLSGKTKWMLTKKFAYSTLCTVLALLTIFSIIILF